ncbi:MAG: glycosyltransferase family 39 protein [Dyadobacter sp.]|uniref:ArnT family glycosyltransferase n=1 Tax=Dyadobacter sp. TaxID=1914288 RepID=UPI0032652E3B
MVFLYWITFFLFLYGISFVAKRIAQPSLTEWIITCFVLFVGSIIPTGFVLSALDLTANVFAWIIGNYIALALHFAIWSFLIRNKESYSIRSIIANRGASFRLWFGELSPYLKTIFAFMFGTLAIIAVTNLILVLFTVPNEWDSMTGHLNRAIRYIQRGTMEHFGGTNWSMDTYPKSLTTIHIYSYLISGDVENAFKLIHQMAYYVTLVSVFGITQRIGRNLSASFFCALAYSVFLDFLMQAVTTETDIVLTAYLGCLLYFLFTYYTNRDSRYLYLTGITFAIVTGHKATFALLMPSVFVIMIYTVFLAPGFKVFLERTLRLGLAISFFALIYTVPTGYIRNIQVFGHPIGPATARYHQSYERAGGAANLFEQGSRNVIRYTYDFWNLDGIRNAQWGYDLNTAIRKPLVILEDKLHMRLDEETDFTIVPFSFQRGFYYYNANPYWGVFGFALILPLMLLVLIRIFRSRVHFFLVIAFCLNLAAISYSAAYDPFKGRYFMEAGIFGVLFLLLLFSNHRLSIIKPRRNVWKGYIMVVVGLACISGIMAVYLNIRCLPFASYGVESAFKMDRIPYQTFARPDVTKAYMRFDSIVPENATVALATVNSDFEYPLYGKDLTRRLISINPFEEGLRPIPKDADYLFYARKIVNDTSKIRALPTDIRLGSDTTLYRRMFLSEKGEDYYLRKLK